MNDVVFAKPRVWSAKYMAEMDVLRCHYAIIRKF